MALMIDVPCTACGTRTVPVPANATALASYATCPDCATAAHTIDHDEILAAQKATRQQAIEKAWADRTPSFFRTHDLVDDPQTVKRITQASANRAPLIVYGQNAQKRSAVLWRYAAALGTAGVRSPEVGGGNEADTLAMATTADFKLINDIKRDYLNPRYKAVLIDGIGEGRFINENRRHEEWGILARTMLAHGQIPLFTCNFWAPDNPRTNPFRTPDLIKWVGVNAAADLAVIYDRQAYLPLEVV